MSPRPCPHSIRRVCVHARGALVTRSVAINELKDLGSGSCQLLLEGITPQADPGSFRVEVLGGRQVTSLQVAHRALSGPEALDPSSLRARRDELLARSKELDLLVTQAQHERDVLRATTPNLSIERKDSAPVARIQDGLAVDAVLHELQTTTDARVLELTRERMSIDRELAELSSQLQSPARSGLTTAITLALGPELSPVDDLSLVYVVRAARWWPAYSARLAAGGREGTWSLDAILAQVTGEDWSGVELVLSTADLVSDARLPELPARRLGRAQTAQPKGYRPPPEGLDALFQGYEGALRRAEQDPTPVSLGLGSSQGVSPFDSNISSSGSYSLGGEGGGDPFGGPAHDDADDYRSDGASRREPGDYGTGDYGTGAYAALEDSSAAFFDSEDELEVEMEREVLGAPPPEANKIAMSSPSSMQAAPAPSAAPKSMKRRSRGGAPPGGGGAPPPPAPLPELPLEPTDAWLDFDRLVLSGRGAGATQRGRLSKAALTAPGDRAACLEVEALSGPPNARDPKSERGSFDFQFEARGLADIPSGGALTRVGVREFPVAVAQVLSVVPAIDDTIYREAELQNPLDVPLLGGPIEVYLDGSLLTTTALDKVGRGGEVRFGLGAEDRVRIARNVRVREETSGLIGKTTAVEHSVTLEVRSSLSAPVTLRVTDRVPVVAHGEEDLKVRILSSDPPAEPYTQEERGLAVRGGLRWELQLAPGERRELSFVYVLELPAKREVQGGNRRD